MNPNKRQRILTAAEGYLDLDMPTHAIRELDSLRTVEEHDYESELLRAEALGRLERFEEALNGFHLALSYRPESVKVLTGMARCYKCTGRIQRAIEAAETAYRLCPDDPLLLYTLACYFCIAGCKEQSLSWLGRALRMDSDLYDLIPDESDFDPLRSDPDFRFIVESCNRER